MTLSTTFQIRRSIQCIVTLLHRQSCFLIKTFIAIPSLHSIQYTDFQCHISKMFYIRSPIICAIFKNFSCCNRAINKCESGEITKSETRSPKGLNSHLKTSSTIIINVVEVITYMMFYINYWTNTLSIFIKMLNCGSL